MKALVTGAGGQLGQALLKNAPAGWSCQGLSRSDLDLTDACAIARTIHLHAPDVVINAAAYTSVDRAEDDEKLAFLVNSTAVEVLSEALDRHGGHLVQLSSDFVFDGLGAKPYLPGDQRGPLSVYGASKAAGEDAAAPSAAVLRTSWVYGAGGANFVTTMLRLMRGDATVRVVCDQVGAPTWTQGLAEVVWAFAQRRARGTFHYSDAGVASWYDLAVAVQEEALALGLLQRALPVVPIRTADYPTAARRPAFSVLDSRATLDTLKRDPIHWRVNLRFMLAEQIRLESQR